MRTHRGTEQATTDHRDRSLAERFQAADRLLPQRWRDLFFSADVVPHWIAGTSRFWYAHQSRDGTRFSIADPEAHTVEPAFDHARMADALSSALDRSITPAELPIDGLDAREPGSLRLHVEGRTWIWNQSKRNVAMTEEPAPRAGESISPDGRWAIRIKEHNLLVRDRFTGDERPVTTEGVEGYAFGTQIDPRKFRFAVERFGLEPSPVVVWSPDSTRLLTHRIDQRALPLMHFVQSSPDEGGYPRLFSERYATLGGPAIPVAELVVADIESGSLIWADTPPLLVPFDSPIAHGQAWWASDGDFAYFISATRGDRIVRMLRLDPSTGETEVLVEEESQTHVQLQPTWPGEPNIRMLRGGEIIWWSERSGWGHLYIRDTNGTLRSLTSGDWVVCSLVGIDEDARVAVFTAAGREPVLDPYLRQLYRVGLDDLVVERVTNDDLDHEVLGSPNGRFFVDIASSLTHPGLSCVRDGNGCVVLDLERGDAQLLYDAGWRPPERFTVKAADGVTDLYGVLFKPDSVDDGRPCAVLDDIYPGPQINAATVGFCRRGPADHAASMAALGFVVVVLDGRGGPLRGKAFHDKCRGGNEFKYLDDHASAIRQLASTRPWMDLDKVGIYGYSAGGRAATHALLSHGDLFKAGVAGGALQDLRLYHPIWGEKYIGLVEEVDYGELANARFVDALKGKLLLIHGELDDNVTVHQALRFTDALLQAGKSFELLIVPNTDHSMLLHHASWVRPRWEHFVRHLLAQEPPPTALAEISVDRDTLAALVD